ncbi:hypothetical protein [Paraburkholderia caribensis]|uniref:hypothetical protein n=1 Tax=Paraburkholderia caribensis TaxID=75105 RepID=UPI001590A0D5|nr:hypothetical protein [Paraburkholderia caribensis]
MHLPRWYVKPKTLGAGGTIDLDEYEAEALPARRQLVTSRHLLPVEQVADQWSARGRTSDVKDLSLTVEIDGRPYAPAFLLDPTLDPVAVEHLALVLSELSAWSKWQFFTSKNGSLGGDTPLDAIRKGNRDGANRAARAFLDR